METEKRFITRDNVIEGYRYQPIAMLGEMIYAYSGTIGLCIENDPDWLERVKNSPDKYVEGVAIDLTASHEIREYVFLPDCLGNWHTTDWNLETMPPAIRKLEVNNG